jgi:hypothetical protein
MHFPETFFITRDRYGETGERQKSAVSYNMYKRRLQRIETRIFAISIEILNILQANTQQN